jgi:hypothetical protein
MAKCFEEAIEIAIRRELLCCLSFGILGVLALAAS